jgi:minor extracellular serine protease Vpr
VDEPITSKSNYSSVRAVGVRSDVNSPLGGDATDPLILFAVNTHKRWSTPVLPVINVCLFAEHPQTWDGFNIFIDVDPQNGNGADYVVFPADDFHIFDEYYYSGLVGTFVYSIRSGFLFGLDTSATFATTDSSTMILPILSSFLCVEDDPCLNATNPRFTYSIGSYDYPSGNYYNQPGIGSFNPFTPSMSFSSPQLSSVKAGKSASTVIQIDPSEYDMTPALGVLVVAADNKAGKDQALELALPSNIKATKMPAKKAKGKGK